MDDYTNLQDFDPNPIEPTASPDRLDVDTVTWREPLAPASDWTRSAPNPAARWADDTDDGEMHGSPSDALEFWHVQAYPDSCAVVCQEFILDELTGQDHTEAELVAEAEARGYYLPGTGTPCELVGALLEAHGVGVERHWGSSLDDIRAELDAGHKVLVAVDGDELYTAGYDALRDDVFGDAGAWPGLDANHCVEVVGVDDSLPGWPRVILSDPGSPGGRGLTLDGEKFEAAWSDSGGFLCHTTGQPPTPTFGLTWTRCAPMIAGSDGTWERSWYGGYEYHYDNDGHYTGDWR